MQTQSASRAGVPQSGYRSLVAYKKSEVIQQGTEIFCRRFLENAPASRAEGMIANALRCKQSIVDGSNAAATSASRELEYTNAARDALDELKNQIFAYLNDKGVEPLDPANPKAQAMRDWSRRHDDWESWRIVFETRDDITLCNVMLTVVSQTSYLLKRLIFSQEEDMRTYPEGKERPNVVRAPMRDEVWSKAIYSFLDAATNKDELSARVERIIAEAHTCRDAIITRRGLK